MWHVSRTYWDWIYPELEDSSELGDLYGIVSLYCPSWLYYSVLFATLVTHGVLKHRPSQIMAVAE
jgi:hypothetical protein